MAQLESATFAGLIRAAGAIARLSDRRASSPGDIGDLALPMWMLDALIFSSSCASGVGAVLTLAVGLVLGGELPWTAAALACSGTFVVYNVDRMRDLDGDRDAHPLRSEFIERNRISLTVACWAALGAAAICGWRLGPWALAVCALVLVPGLFHRRLKRLVPLKVLYVAAAWVVVVVGLAAIAVIGGQEIAVIGGQEIAVIGGQEIAVIGGQENGGVAWGWATIAIAGPVSANLIASNLAELEFAPLGISRRFGLGLAGGLAAASGLAALLAPAGFAALAWVAGGELLSLAWHREDERYLGVLDGGLLLGGALAVALA